VNLFSEKDWVYYDFGPKECVPLVCIPGITGTPDVFYKQMISLCPKGYRIIAVCILFNWLILFSSQRYCDKNVQNVTIKWILYQVESPAYTTHERWLKGFDRFLDTLKLPKVLIQTQLSVSFDCFNFLLFWHEHWTWPITSIHIFLLNLNNSMFSFSSSDSSLWNCIGRLLSSMLCSVPTQACRIVDFVYYILWYTILRWQRSLCRTVCSLWWNKHKHQHKHILSSHSSNSINLNFSYNEIQS
jgi:hypothetical protein